MDFPENLTELSDAELNELREAANSAIAAFAGETTPTLAQIEDAETHETHLEQVGAEFTRREEAAARAASIRDRHAARAEAAVEPTEPPVEDAPVEDEPVEDEPTEDEKPVEDDKAPSLATRRTQTARTQTVRPANRPDLPASRNRSGSTATITVAHDVPDVPAGTRFEQLSDMAELLMNRLQGFVPPQGDGLSTDWRNAPFARISKGIPDEFKVRDRASEEEFWEVVNRAIDDSRLEGGNLVAAGGWCSPSEVAYDLCEGESLDGILSSPEIGLGRGGLKYTMGPDWSDIYGNGFGTMTEAQAIAGATKTPFEIPCTTWVESRLDAIYQWVKIPILMESTYPELIKRWLRGLVVSYAHKMNERHISQIVAALPTPISTLTDFTTTAGSLANALILIADRERNVRRWKFNQAIEVVLPFWVKGAIKADLALRSNRDTSAVSDAEVAAIFSTANVLPQWVYDWQDLAPTAVVYPKTFNAALYKAGTFVKGSNDVIKLDTVYDAASLAQNVYTGLFMEEGMNTMKMCQGGQVLTIPTCQSGHTGIANINVCGSSTT